MQIKKIVSLTVMSLALLSSGCFDHIGLGGSGRIPVRVRVSGSEGIVPIEEALTRGFYGLDTRRIALSLSEMNFTATKNPCGNPDPEEMGFELDRLPDAYYEDILVNSELEAALRVELGGSFYVDRPGKGNDGYRSRGRCDNSTIRNPGDLQTLKFELANYLIEEIQKDLVDNEEAAYLSVFDIETSQTRRISFEAAEFICSLTEQDFGPSGLNGDDRDSVHQYTVAMGAIFPVLERNCTLVLTASFDDEAEAE